MRGIRLLALLFAVALVAAACGDSAGENDANASLAQTLIGTWEFSTPAFVALMQINEDGSYGFLMSSGSTVDSGQYEIEGDLITLRADDSSVCGGATGQYRMTFDGTDTVNFVLVEDECGHRLSDVDASQLVRTSG